jgi:hypothetical protein
VRHLIVPAAGALDLLLHLVHLLDSPPDIRVGSEPSAQKRRGHVLRDTDAELTAPGVLRSANQLVA